MPRPASIVAVAVSTSILALLSAPAANADDVTNCIERSPRGYCIEWDVETPGGPGRSGGSGGDTPPDCYWETMPNHVDDPTIYADFGLDYPPEGLEIIWQSWECSDSRTTSTFRWVPAVTPGNLAGLARGRLIGELPQPTVESSPPLGTASIIGVPVFVMVTNWTGVVSENECAGGLCVTVTATPQLLFDPGEPGSISITCVDSGTRYVGGGAPLEVQAAAPGACAWPYRLRTAADGRPTAWPGEVSVTWTIVWTATSGASGTLPAVTRSTAVPRSVAEVQTVISGGATP